MEESQNYKGLNITYYEIIGSTVVTDSYGNVVKKFIAFGCKGIDMSKKWIDEYNPY